MVRAADVEFSTGILQSGTNQLALLEAYSLDPATDATESGSGRMERIDGVIQTPFIVLGRWPFNCCIEGRFVVIEA